MNESDSGELVWVEGHDYARVTKTGCISICVNHYGITLHPKKWWALAEQSHLPMSNLSLSERIELIPKVQPKIKLVREEIFRLAKSAPNIEIMHWYMWLDECFENDKFSPDDFGKVQWRIMALSDKEGFKVNYLKNLITPILQAYGCVDEAGRPNKPVVVEG